MKRHKLLLTIGLLTTLITTGWTADDAADKPASASLPPPPEAVTALYRQIKPQEIPDNAIKLVGNDWMLISAGTEEKFNGMTASWGGFGVWNRPVAFILVHKDRYTYEFLEREEYFTLSFFEEKYRPALKLFGTKSGRDMDKPKAAGLTPLAMKPGMAYAEARLIVVCKKIYADPTHAESWFPPRTPSADPTRVHKLYFGEIVSVWIKK